MFSNKLALTLLLALVGCASVGVPDQARTPRGVPIGGGGGGTTHNAASCSYADVEAKRVIAVAGDTINIPAGDCTWATQLNLTVGIRLIGAGITETIIRDNVTKDGSDDSAILGTVDSPNSLRISGFHLIGVAPNPNGSGKGHIRVIGTTRALRIDHIKMTELTTSGIFLQGDLRGVIDHIEMIKTFQNGVIIYHDAWGGSTYGDGSWADALTPGSEHMMFIEDSVFTELSVAQGAVNDCLDGGRFVFRYNTVNNDMSQAHGTDTGQRRRSCRWQEVYENQFNFAGNASNAHYKRGGSGVFFNNTYVNTAPCGGCPDSGYNNLLTLIVQRAITEPPPWGFCDGTSPYDQNSGGGSGYRCVDQPGAGTSNHLNGLATPTEEWVGNALEPIYQWDNVFGTDLAPTASGGGHVVLNRDYYNNTARPGYTSYTYPHPLAVP